MLATAPTAIVSDAARVPVAEMDGRWLVVQTQSQYEQRLQRELDAAGVNSFLPLVKRRCTSDTNRRDRLVPLFPSYVFVCGDASAQYEIRRSRATLALIPVANQARLAAELSAIERAIVANVRLHHHPELHVGRRCRVTGGPLMGVEGEIISRTDGAKTFVVAISLLKAWTTMDVDPDLLEPVE